MMHIVSKVSVVESGFILGDKLLKILLNNGGSFGRLVELDQICVSDNNEYKSKKVCEVSVYCLTKDTIDFINLIDENHSDSNHFISCSEVAVNDYVYCKIKQRMEKIKESDENEVYRGNEGIL